MNCFVRDAHVLKKLYIGLCYIGFKFCIDDRNWGSDLCHRLDRIYSMPVPIKQAESLAQIHSSNSYIGDKAGNSLLLSEVL